MTKDNSTGKDKEFYELGKKLFDLIPPFAQLVQPVQPAPITLEAAIVHLVEALCQSKGWMHAYADAKVRDALEAAPQQAEAVQQDISIDALVAEFEATPKGLAAMQEGRQWVRETLVQPVQPDQDWEAVAADQALTIALLRSEAITQAIPQIPQEPSSNEPVAFLCHGNLFMWPSEDDSCGNPEDHIPLYTSPPQRPWVGLTDEETMRVAYKAGFNIEVDNDAEEASEELHWWDGNGEQSDDVLFKLRDYIEAKLKGKNI